MPIIDLVLQGVGLMLAGMGIVFGFLLILVGTLCSASFILQRFFPETDAGNNVQAAGTNSANSGSCLGDRKLIAVISAALGRYRADQ